MKIDTDITTERTKELRRRRPDRRDLEVASCDCVQHGRYDYHLEREFSSYAIDDITDHINLLGLNATIESARAGEAGRGFSVVAAEVKHLANQTKRATVKIAQEIEGLNSISDDVVSVLSLIEQSIGNVSEYVTSKAVAIREQVTVTNEMSNSIHRAAMEAAEVVAT